ncbi:hypothetical protein GCM10027074_77790 [Streptomyces deserti]
MILRADLDAPRKQRHTVTQIFHRLIEEHAPTCPIRWSGAMSPTGSLKIAVEAGKAPIEAFIPQTHPPGM